MDVTTLERLSTEAETLTQNGEYSSASDRYAIILGETSRWSSDTAVKELRLMAFAEQSQLMIQMDEYETGLNLAEDYYNEAVTYHHKLAALLRIGTHAMHSGRYRYALSICQQASSLAQKQGDPLGKAKSLACIAFVYFDMGRLEEAIAEFNHVLQMLERLDRCAERGPVLNRLGLAYQRRGQIDKAILCHQQCVQLSACDKNTDRHITALNNLGESYLMLFHIEKALAYFNKGLMLVDKRTRQESVADLHRNRGVAFCRLYEMDAALVDLYQALALSEKIGNASIRLQTYYSLALAELQAGHLEEGLAYGRKLEQGCSPG